MEISHPAEPINVKNRIPLSRNTSTHQVGGGGVAVVEWQLLHPGQRRNKCQDGSRPQFRGFHFSLYFTDLIQRPTPLPFSLSFSILGLFICRDLDRNHPLITPCQRASQQKRGGGRKGNESQKDSRNLFGCEYFYGSITDRVRLWICEESRKDMLPWVDMRWRMWTRKRTKTVGGWCYWKRTESSREESN